MRQVPKYLLISNGRLSRHLQYYFLLLNLPYNVWCRRDSAESLQSFLKISTHVLVLTTDDAIESFIKKHLPQDICLIHCSGSLVSNFAVGAHPLFTFHDQLYDLDTYKRIPFVLDEDAPPFSDLFPGLANPAVYLKKELKLRYHAVCAMSANFSCMLWQKLFATFEEELQIPMQLAIPLLQQQMLNLYDSPARALTGPLTRGDTQTIAKHIAALEGDPFQSVYTSFINCYAKITKRAV